MRGLCGIAAALALAACSPATAPPREAAPSPPPSSSAATAPAAPSSSAATASAPPPSLFSPALVSKDWITLYRLSNAIVAVRQFDGYQFAVAEKDDFVLRPELSKGFPAPGTSFAITNLIGSFPDALWMVLRITDRSRPISQSSDVVHRFENGAWKIVDRRPPDQPYVGFWEAPSGCLHGLLAPTGKADGGYFTSKVVVRTIDCKGRTPSLPGLLKGPDKGLGRRIYEMAGLPSGDLALLDQESDPVLLELWPRNSASPSTFPLPPSPAPPSDRVLLARAANEVYVAMNVKEASPWVVRFDGAAWTPLERPPVVAYSEIVLASDGALLMRSNAGASPGEVADGLWRKRPGEPWSSLGSVPVGPTVRKPCLPKQITGRSGDDVWVFCWAGSEGSMLYHTRPAAKIVEL